MGVLDSFGGLISSTIASVVLLVFTIFIFFVTVLIIQVGAGLAGYSPSGDFVALSAAILSASSIVAGASPMSRLTGGT